MNNLKRKLLPPNQQKKTINRIFFKIFICNLIN